MKPAKKKDRLKDKQKYFDDRAERDRDFGELVARKAVHRPGSVQKS